MAKHSPAELSLAMLRRWGWQAAMVERFIAAIKIRQDLFGIIDILGMSAERGIIGVQCCSLDAYQKHIEKYRDPDLVYNIKTWLQANGRYEIWAWGRRKDDGEDRTVIQITAARYTPGTKLQWHNEKRLHYKSVNPGKTKEEPL